MLQPGIHVVSALDFNQEFFIKMKPVENTQEGAVLLESMIVDVLGENHQFKYVVIGMESTGFYGVHLANYLSASDSLAPFSVRVYCLNPKEVKNYKKSFNDIGENDGIDSFVIAGPEETAKIVQAAARNSYRLDKCLYEPLTISIASSFNCIRSFEKELKAIDKAILQTVQGLNPDEYTVLNSIPGIGKVYSAGILAEIGSVKVFQSADSL